MKTVFVAGATGYLGRHIVRQYKSMGWRVRALVRDAAAAREKGIEAHELFHGEATAPDSLRGAMEDVDLVISTLGITRQRDGLGYWDVDYQANVNILTAALTAGVGQFAYLHVLHAEQMRHVPLVAAKQAFAERLSAAPIRSTIIAPTGFFSDMADILAMARGGRIWLFGSGALRLNPIEGADLAKAIAEAVQQELSYMTAGGPDILTQQDLAEAAFAALGTAAKITFLPDVLRRVAIKILPWVTPAHVHGPALFFLSALGRDMVAPPRGSKRLASHFADLVRGQTAAEPAKPDAATPQTP